MKKLITILTIMIVLVGAVFADPAATSTGNTSILVTTSISAVEPTFKLYSGAIESLLADQTVDEAKAAAVAANHPVVIDTNSLLTEAQTVTFKVSQITNSRSIKAYTLAAEATDLVLYKYKNAQNQDVLEETTAHPAAAGKKKFEVQATTVNTFANGSLSTDDATYGGDGSAKTITYKGTSIDVTGQGKAPIDVATFTCTWNPNDQAVTGDYRATVTLKITSSF